MQTGEQSAACSSWSAHRPEGAPAFDATVAMARQKSSMRRRRWVRWLDTGALHCASALLQCCVPMLCRAGLQLRLLRLVPRPVLVNGKF